MMQEFIPQILLPITLFLLMFSMGVGLSLVDFRRVFQFPKAFVVGLSLQLFLLPCLAVLIAFVLELSPIASAGLFLVSLCPGGATSNFFSFIAKGNVALSISLTAVTSFIVPISLPILFACYVSYLSSNNNSTLIELPVLKMMLQLFVVGILPVALGMFCKKCFPSFVSKVENKLKTLTSGLMFLVVILLIVINIPLMKSSFSTNGAATLLLCLSALVISYSLAAICISSKKDIRTVALEVGVQNAGTAMLVAFTVLKQPELANIPLLYGVLMNFPVLIFIAWIRFKHK